MIDEHENKRQILRSTIQERSKTGRGVRPHELEKAVDIAEILWRGQKGSGQAAQEAIDLIVEGKA